MSLKKMKTDELYFLFGLVQEYSKYTSRHLHISENDKKEYTKWLNTHTVVQNKLQMIYNEISQRIKLIEE